MRRFWLMLTDPRFKAALPAVERAGAGLGDLAAAPDGAAAFFKPLRERLALAALAAGRNPVGTAVLAAAEDFAIRLEKFFTDMALHKTSPDAPVMEALLCLQRACAAAPALLSPKKKDGAAARVRAFCAGGRKSLRLAKAASDSDRVNFPQNLKFGSMYSGLDGVFDALENYVRALHSA